jgi:hypothetical protein
MGNKKINIVKLLKNCPKGMELDCAMYENCTLVEVDETDLYPIIIEGAGFTLRFSKYGQTVIRKDAKCVIFPKGKTTWEGFVPPFKDGYPKTYKECCDILGLDTMANDAQGYKSDLIIGLQELIICRDAYWKGFIGGPWCPDYEIDEDGTGTVKFCIRNLGGEIKKIETTISNTILAFPTEEMRDAFYYNFKDSIERSKELL